MGDREALLAMGHKMLPLSTSANPFQASSGLILVHSCARWVPNIGQKRSENRETGGAILAYQRMSLGGFVTLLRASRVGTGRSGQAHRDKLILVEVF
jgi:hypothetical protein